MWDMLLDAMWDMGCDAIVRQKIGCYVGHGVGCLNDGTWGQDYMWDNMVGCHEGYGVGFSFIKMGWDPHVKNKLGCHVGLWGKKCNKKYGVKCSYTIMGWDLMWDMGSDAEYCYIIFFYVQVVHKGRDAMWDIGSDPMWDIFWDCFVLTISHL